MAAVFNTGCIETPGMMEDGECYATYNGAIRRVAASISRVFTTGCSNWGAVIPKANTELDYPPGSGASLHSRDGHLFTEINQ